MESSVFSGGCVSEVVRPSWWQETLQRGPAGTGGTPAPVASGRRHQQLLPTRRNTTDRNLCFCSGFWGRRDPAFRWESSRMAPVPHVAPDDLKIPIDCVSVPFTSNAPFPSSHSFRCARNICFCRCHRHRLRLDLFPRPIFSHSQPAWSGVPEVPGWMSVEQQRRVPGTWHLVV